MKAATRRLARLIIVEISVGADPNQPAADASIYLGSLFFQESQWMLAFHHSHKGGINGVTSQGLKFRRKRSHGVHGQLQEVFLLLTHVGFAVLVCDRKSRVAGGILTTPVPSCAQRKITDPAGHHSGDHLPFVACWHDDRRSVFLGEIIDGADRLGPQEAAVAWESDKMNRRLVTLEPAHPAEY